MTTMQRTLLAVTLCLIPLTVGHAIEISVIGGLSRDATVKPGEKVEGKIVVLNSATTPQQVKVYQTDFAYSADGTAHYDPPGKVARSNAAWVTFTPQQFEVPAKDTVSLVYTIQVPNQADLKGTYWSMLMIEPLAPDSPEMVTPTGGTEPRVAVRTVMRYGVQMITDVGDDGKIAVKFGDKKLVAQEGRRALQLDVENSGERRVEPLVWVDLYGADGISIGRFEASRQRLLPGCSARFTCDLTGVPAGTYTALAVVDNGDENVFGTQLKLEIK
jgi:hypothetical protein